MTYEWTHTYVHTYTHTYTHTHDNYSNPRCAHARRGLIIMKYVVFVLKESCDGEDCAS